MESEPKVFTEEEINYLIKKEADALCKFRMDQFFESIRNIIKIKENTFTSDPYHWRDLSELKESQRIIVERYKKECTIPVPYDIMVIENRQKYKENIRSHFERVLYNRLRGKIQLQEIMSIEKFIIDRVEGAFELDNNMII
jgi:hypothetical protein